MHEEHLIRLLQRDAEALRLDDEVLFTDSGTAAIHSIHIADRIDQAIDLIRRGLTHGRPQSHIVDL